jgi:hypothetical protein
MESFNELPTISNMFQKVCKEYEKEIDNFALYIATELFLYAPYFKSDRFKEEQEYRFCFYYDEKDKSKHKSKRERHPAYSDNIEFRERNGSIIPYIKVNLRHDGNNIPINRIMIGAKNNSDTSLTGTEYFLMKNGYDNTEVSWRSIPRTSRKSTGRSSITCCTVPEHYHLRPWRAIEPLGRSVL